MLSCILGLNRALRITNIQRRTFSSQLGAVTVFDSDVDDLLTDDVKIKVSMAEAAEEFRREHQIQIKGIKIGEYPPMMDFSSTPYSPSIQRIFKLEGYDAPTPTQSQSWPIALGKRDIISVARTGSGKTCGFLLPAFHKIMKSRPEVVAPARGTRQGSRYRPAIGTGKPPTVLVLAPTRELALQINEQARKFGMSSGIKSTCLYGGASRGQQASVLRQGVDVVIGTPGRCFDLASSGDFDMSRIDYVVLDEADRMLDMGFEPQIREIFSQLPEEKQCLFFTATWPKSIEQLANEFLRNPVQISIGDNDVLNANKAITQNIIMTAPYEKHNQLEKLLSELKTSDPKLPPNAIPKTIIFVSRKNQCEDLVDHLSSLGLHADSLHGDKTQAVRSRTMDRFRSGSTRILVATDVAARGLDVKVSTFDHLYIIYCSLPPVHMYIRILL